MEYVYGDCLIHHGIKGQKWGVRRYQETSGKLTSAGKKRYSAASAIKIGLERAVGAGGGYIEDAEKKRAEEIIQNMLKTAANIGKDNVAYAVYKDGSYGTLYRTKSGVTESIKHPDGSYTERIAAADGSSLISREYDSSGKPKGSYKEEYSNPERREKNKAAIAAQKAADDAAKADAKEKKNSRNRNYTDMLK